MKREHETTESYVDWLKRLGCVFYAPLDGQNGLKDLISGVDGEVMVGSSAVYDSSEQCYFVKKEGSGYCALRWSNLDMHLYDSANDYFKASYLIEHKTTKGRYNNCSQTMYPCLYNRGHAANVGSQSHHLQLNVWYKRCVSYFRDGGHQTLLYCNGSLDWTANHSSLRWSALTTPQQGVEWQNMGTYVTEYNNHYTYLKNLMIFNRNLSQQDIIEIQG